MKKLVIVSRESVFSGSARSGVGETVDSLANSLGKAYDTTVVCVDGQGILTKVPGNMRKVSEHIRTCKVFGVTYYLIAIPKWQELCWKVVNDLNPEILHNFDRVDGILHLTARPKRLIYTFDRRESLGSEDGFATCLNLYDAIRTGSTTYATKLLEKGDALAVALREAKNFGGALNGIATPAYAPEKGLLVSAKYSADSQDGKHVCKERVCKVYGIPKNKTIFLMMCQLTIEKGADIVLRYIHEIRDRGGFTILAGTVSRELETQVRALKNEDGALWISERPNPLKAVPLMAGADFYLCPSVEEPGGLMPMQASRFGVVPIVTPVDALADNFTEDNAIVINDNLETAIASAFDLCANPIALKNMRKACMEQDFSWNARKAEYIALYEGAKE